VELRTDLGVAVERAEAHRDLLAFRPAAAEQRRAADAAEDLDSSALLGRVDAEELLAREEPELLARNPRRRQAESPRMLAAERAVAVVGAAKRKFDLKCDAAAEAATTDRMGHGATLHFGCRCGSCSS
jgi:hypothetical protein